MISQTTQSTLKILSLLLTIVTPIGGAFMALMSVFLTDSPRTSAAMATYLGIYWSVAILLYVVSLVVNIVAWSNKSTSWWTFGLALFTAIICASPLVGFLGYALIQ